MHERFKSMIHSLLLPSFSLCFFHVLSSAGVLSAQLLFLLLGLTLLLSARSSDSYSVWFLVSTLY